ncbi:hypothetical protein C0993_010225 [Termitomyces sp. T159_Od127]|nr:hypothetical protein C0993_010225 [Termitomyces sp. T159_Od127]
MDHDTLKGRLGMGDPIPVKTGDSPQGFLLGIQKALNGYKKPCDLGVIVETVTAWDCASLFGLLKTYTVNINDRSEAAARIIIDPWIISCMQLVETININYRTVLFPELLVCSARSQTDPPAMIEYEKNVTFLAGTIDYVALNYHLPSKSDDRDRHNERRIDISKVVKGDNAARALYVFTGADTISICEAKRKSKKLEEHEPQVVAECLALFTKLKTYVDTL